MARGIIRKPSFNKIVGAYRSRWKRFWMRLFTFGIYGSKGVGWWKNPKKAWYNFWYYRTSISVYKILGCKPSRGACFCAMLIASIVSIFAAPVDATRAGVKAHKIKKERKARAEGTSTRTSDSRKAPTSGSTASTRTGSAPSSYLSNMPKETHNYSFSSQFPKDEKPATVAAKVEETKEPDENTPKSNPKHERDQYIRKRMIIAGSSYCDKTVLESLAVGTYFDLEAEPDNPYDKDAVKLTYNGQKIGYIAKQDH